MRKGKRIKADGLARSHDIDTLNDIINNIEKDIEDKKIRHFSSDDNKLLQKSFSEVPKIFCDCVMVDVIEKEIEPLRVEDIGNVFNVFGNIASDVFGKIRDIFEENGGSKKCTVFAVGDFLYSDEYKRKIPHGESQICIKEDYFVIDLRCGTFEIYPKFQSGLYYKVVVL